MLWHHNLYKSESTQWHITPYKNYSQPDNGSERQNWKSFKYIAATEIKFDVMIWTKYIILPNEQKLKQNFS